MKGCRRIKDQDYRVETLHGVLVPALWSSCLVTRGPEGRVPEIQRVIRQIDGRLALADVKTMEQIVGDSLRQQRMSAVMIAGFALGALILAAMGLFGIVSDSSPDAVTSSATDL